MLSNCGAGEDSWESLGLNQSRKSTLNTHWNDWCWSWSSNTLATWCEELTNWKRPWCWERRKAEGAGTTEHDGQTASLTWWTWVWASSGSWWWTGKPDMLKSVGLQRVGQKQLKWLTEPTYLYILKNFIWTILCKSLWSTKTKKGFNLITQIFDELYLWHLNTQFPSLMDYYILFYEHKWL